MSMCFIIQFQVVREVAGLNFCSISCIFAISSEARPIT